MTRQLLRLLWWMVLGALLGGISSALDGLVLGLLGGALFGDDPLQAGVFLGWLLGLIGTCAGALLGAGACCLLPRLVLQPPGEMQPEAPAQVNQ